MDGWIVPENFEDDTPEAQKARETLGAQVVVEDVPQYLSAGLQLGERYEDSPIVFPADTPAPEDRWDIYTPLDRPGGRAPHFFIAPGQSLYDAFGKGFTLLAFGAADTAPIEAAAATRGVPLATVRVDTRNDLYSTPLVLIRPDQHIAWRGDTINENDALAIVDRIRGE
jgi:hypothetical protein